MGNQRLDHLLSKERQKKSLSFRHYLVLRDQVRSFKNYECTRHLIVAFSLADSGACSSVWLERTPDKREVDGSTPSRPTIFLSANRGCSSAGRAPALHAGGHRFEPVHLHHAARPVLYRSIKVVVSNATADIHCSLTIWIWVTIF